MCARTCVRTTLLQSGLPFSSQTAEVLKLEYIFIHIPRNKRIYIIFPRTCDGSSGEYTIVLTAESLPGRNGGVASSRAASTGVQSNLTTVDNGRKFLKCTVIDLVKTNPLLFNVENSPLTVSTADDRAPPCTSPGAPAVSPEK